MIYLSYCSNWERAYNCWNGQNYSWCWLLSQVPLGKISPDPSNKFKIPLWILIFQHPSPNPYCLLLALPKDRNSKSHYIKHRWHKIIAIWNAYLPRMQTKKQKPDTLTYYKTSNATSAHQWPMFPHYIETSQWICNANHQISQWWWKVKLKVVEERTRELTQAVKNTLPSLTSQGGTKWHKNRFTEKFRRYENLHVF